MILETKEDFQSAILKGETINTTTIFWTGERPNVDLLKLAPIAFADDGFAIGEYDEENGVYCGTCKGKQIWVGKHNAPEKMTWQEAKDWCENYNRDEEETPAYHLPTQQELMIIYANKEIINQALIDNDCEPLNDGWYWSSSEYAKTNFAWIQYFSNGYVVWNLKDYNGYVRPVLAL